jgi:hypothetical protein
MSVLGQLHHLDGYALSVRLELRDKRGVPTLQLECVVNKRLHFGPKFERKRWLKTAAALSHDFFLKVENDPAC